MSNPPARTKPTMKGNDGLDSTPQPANLASSLRRSEGPADLKMEIKHLIVENLMLQIGADQIADDQPLFGPDSLGLDSVDALQLVVALDKTYGLKIADPDAARRILESVNTIAAAVASHRTH